MEKREPLMLQFFEFRSRKLMINCIQYLQKDKPSIYFDEIHTYLKEDNFRPKLMMALQKIIQVESKIVFLTATLPLHMERNINDYLHKATVIRLKTVRPNIKYIVLRGVTLDNVIGTIKLEQHERVIIFFKSIKDVDEAQISNSTKYHSKLLDSEARENVGKWRIGLDPIMRATSGFGVGIDYPYVTYVIHVNGFHSLVDFAQESGRGGRGGQVSRAIILPGTKLSEEEKMIIETVECRRRKLQLYLDNEGDTCIDGGYELCDNCQQELEENEENEEELKIRAEKNRSHELEVMEIVNSLFEIKNFNMCLFHAFDGQVEAHPTFKCSLSQGCFSCFDRGHTRDKCPFVMKFDRTRCYFCGLPKTILNKELHQETEFGSRNCPYKDFIKPVICSIRKNGKFNKEALEKLYQQDTYGMTSGMKIFVKCLRDKKML